MFYGKDLKNLLALGKNFGADFLAYKEKRKLSADQLAGWSSIECGFGFCLFVCLVFPVITAVQHTFLLLFSCF